MPSALQVSQFEHAESVQLVAVRGFVLLVLFSEACLFPAPWLSHVS